MCGLFSITLCRGYVDFVGEDKQLEAQILWRDIFLECLGEIFIDLQKEKIRVQFLFH